MTDTRKFTSIPPLSLAVDLSSTGLNIKTKTNKDWGGFDISLSMFNADYIPATLINDAKTEVEFILIDASTIGNLTTTGATIYKRGLKYFAEGNASDNDEVTANKKSWNQGSTKLLIGTNPPWMYGGFASKGNDEIITNTWTFTSPYLPRVDVYAPPTNDIQFATKKYVDDTATGTTNVDRVQVEAIAGETLVAGDLVYFDETDDEWKKADATTASSSENVLLGIAQGAGTDGNPIAGGVLVNGVDRNQSGLTNGDIVYVSDTAGSISTTPGTKNVILGYAISATDVYFFPNFKRFLTKDQQDALAGTSGTPSSTNKYVTENDTTNAETVTDTTIAFVASSSTITDSNSGLAGFRVGASITVSGSASNDGTYTITDVTAGVITVAESLTDESAGASVTISAVTNNKLVRYNIVGEIENRIQSFIKNFEYLESISAGDAVKIINNSGTYKAAKIKGFFDRSLSPITGGSSYQVCKVSDYKFVIVSCVNAGTAFRACVAEVNPITNEVSFGSQIEESSSPVHEMSRVLPVRIDDNKVAIVYAGENSGNTNRYVNVQLFSISGTTITSLAGAVTLHTVAAGGKYAVDASMIDTDVLCVAYFDNGTSGIVEVGDVSGNAWNDIDSTSLSEVTSGSNTINNFSLQLYQLENGKCIVSRKESSSTTVRSNIISYSSSVVSIGSNHTVSGTTPRLIVKDASNCLLTYVDAGTTYVLPLSISGTTITSGTSYATSSFTTATQPIYSNERYLLEADANLMYGYTVNGSLQPNEYSVTRVITSGFLPNNNPKSVATFGDDMLFYITGNNASQIYATTSSSDWDQFYGIAIESGVAGDSKPIISIGGIYVNAVGLTPQFPIRLDINGEISQDDSSTLDSITLQNIEFGDAITDTSFIITKLTKI